MLKKWLIYKKIIRGTETMDGSYYIIMIIGLALSTITSAMVKSAFKKGDKIVLRSGLTGAEVAMKVIANAGLDGVRVEQTDGFLTDHYNPVTKKLVLSSSVYHGRSAAAAGVAAHEAGHAIQHAKKYAPLWLRSALVPVANLGSRLGIWLIVIGLALSAGYNYTANTQSGGAAFGGGGISTVIATVGVGLFSAAVLFTLITVPVEFDASRRAKRLLSELAVVQTQEEEKTVASVLLAAGLTYVAAAVSSVLQLLYWLAKLGLLNRRR